MSYRVPWKQPYPPLHKAPQGSVHRITVELPKIDALKLQSIIPTPGFLSFLSQSIIKKAAEYVERHHLTYADAESFIDLCQRTFTGTFETSHPPHVPGGVTGHGAGTPSASHLPTGTGKEAKTGSSQEGPGRGRKGRNSDPQKG